MSHVAPVKNRLTTLKAVRRGIEIEPRDVTMYLIRSMRAEPLMRVGAGFGLNRYSSVSSAVMRVKIKLQRIENLKTALDILKATSLKVKRRLDPKRPNFLIAQLISG